MKKRRAFVSHSSADDSFVAELESFLRASGFDEVFNDVHAIKPDEQFWSKIEESVRNCDTFYVVITAASNNSDWVTREVKFARKIGKCVVPVWREDCPLPSEFSGRDVIDFRSSTRRERRFDISRILKYAPAELIGREEETKLLNDAWQKVLRLEKARPHVLTFVALGGEGKTSLVAGWAVDFAAQDWPGCETCFAWSFYSQGSSETPASSSDLFLKEALNFFAAGDPKEEEIKAFASGPAGAYEKGQRLARLVGQRRSLLILDGLEPLQCAPTSPTSGELKDQGIVALLKGLAQNSQGFCLITTRYRLPDLKAFWKTTSPEVPLHRLSCGAGVHLLKTLGVTGTAQEFEKLVEAVKGHALTLTLLGSYLRDAYGGDIRKRDLIKLEDADAESNHPRHAFHVMDFYVRWLESGGAQGRSSLAILRLLGLFDRPASADCLHALWTREAIDGLTEPLADLNEVQRNRALTRLEDAKLLTVNRDASGALLLLDAHPHIREYFAKQLRKQNPEAWRAGHKRLYEHLCETTKEGGQPTLEDIQPLYQAVGHGCQAGLLTEALENTYRDRILRGIDMGGFYSTRRLGAFGSDLGAVACFFDHPWSRVSPAVDETAQVWLLSQAAYRLHALGQLTAALEPRRVGLEANVRKGNWELATVSATNLAELELTLGNLAGAVRSAEHSETYAERSGSSDWKNYILSHTTVAGIMHQIGKEAEALARFQKTEQTQQERQPKYPLHYSLRGFRYCDLLLTASEQAAWRVIQRLGVKRQKPGLIQECSATFHRAARTLKWGEMNTQDLLSDGLDHLTLGRAEFYRSVLTKSEVRSATSEIELAVSGLRRSGQQQYISLGLLTRAWLRAMTDDLAGAQADLDEAWEIAERGPMRLFMADIYLYRARLFSRKRKYPWASPEADLKAAEKLINDCGYHRRDEELADAKRAILGR